MTWVNRTFFISIRKMAAQSRANAATLRDLHELAAAGVHPVGMISSHASVYSI